MWSRQPAVVRAELCISFRTSWQRKQTGPWLSLRTGRNWFNNRNLLCATCWAWHLELRDKQDEVPALPGLIAFWGNRQAHRPAHQGLVPCAKGAQRSPLNPGDPLPWAFPEGVPREWTVSFSNPPETAFPKQAFDSKSGGWQFKVIVFGDGTRWIYSVMLTECVLMPSRSIVRLVQLTTL